MGGKPKSTSQSYSGSSNPAFQPLALQGAHDVSSVFNQAQPGLQALTDTTQKTVVPGLTGQFQSGLGASNAARGYNMDVLSGKYMSGNPYIKQIMDQLNSQVSNDVNSQFETSGRYGSGAHNQILSRELANADSGILYGNYSDEMNRMGQSAGALQQGGVADTASLLQAISQGAELPYTGSNSMASSLGALFSGGQDKSKQTGANPIWGALGAGLGTAGAVLSDRRLKTNIQLLRRDLDGLGWYSWNWKSDPNGHKATGVIADEVKDLRPQAYVPNFRGDGYDGVNYAAL